MQAMIWCRDQSLRGGTTAGSTWEVSLIHKIFDLVVAQEIDELLDCPPEVALFVQIYFSKVHDTL